MNRFICEYCKKDFNKQNLGKHLSTMTRCAFEKLKEEHHEEIEKKDKEIEKKDKEIEKKDEEINMLKHQVKLTEENTKLKYEVKMINENTDKIVINNTITNDITNYNTQPVSVFKCELQCKNTVQTYLKNTRPITIQLSNIEDNTKYIEKFTHLVNHFCRSGTELTIWRIVNTYERGDTDFLQAFVVINQRKKTVYFKYFNEVIDNKKNDRKFKDELIKILQYMKDKLASQKSQKVFLFDYIKNFNKHYQKFIRSVCNHLNVTTSKNIKEKIVYSIDTNNIEVKE
eukprot:Pgem_evm1s3156